MSDDLKERIREIEESARKVDTLALTLARKDGERKIAKMDWEAAVDKHMELCRHYEDSKEVEERPLIKAVESKGDASWQDEPIDVLGMMGLDAETIETLFAGNIRTLGDLANAADHDFIRSIPGISANVAAQIGEATNRYWDARAADVQDADDDEEEAMEALGRSGLDLVTSRPDSDPESNGVEGPKKAKRRRKARA